MAYRVFVVIAIAFTIGKARAQWTLVGQFQSPISTVQFMADLGDPSLGYVGLSDGELWKTGDGGATWIPVLVPGCNTAITSLSFKSLSEGWLSARQVFPNPSVYHTTDAGVTWTPLTPVSERPSVFYNTATNLLFSTSLLLNDEVSADGGVTWTPLQLKASNGISFSDGMHGIMSNYRGASANATADGGVTWYPTTLAAECWMPLAIKGVDVYYCVSEVSSVVFRSTDMGLTWQQMSRLPARCTGDIDGYCAQLYVATDSGFFVSQDEGATWMPMGGPKNSLSDVRFSLDGYTIYAGDDHGQLWRYNDQSRPFIGRLGFTITSPNSIPSTRLSASGCTPLDVTLHIGANSACLQTFLLNESDSLPANARASKLSLFPHLLDPENSDTIHIHYTPQGNGIDTLRFLCHYSVGGALFDTTLVILASSSPVLDVKSNPAVVTFQAPFNCTVVKTSIAITNGKCDSLQFDSVSFGDSDHFAFVSPRAGVKVAPRGGFSLTISGHGDSTGVYLTVMTVHVTILDSSFSFLIPVTLSVSQNGAVQTVISPTVLNFGSTSVCGKRDDVFYISNPSCQSYSIDSVYWIVHPASFSFAQQPSLPRVLLSNDVDSVVVRFAPLAPGSTSGTLGIRLLVDGVHHDTIIRISGVGYSQSKASLSVGDVKFDSIRSCDRLDTVVYVRNESCDSTEIISITRPGDPGFVLLSPAAPIWIAAGDSVAVHVLLSPIASGLRRDSVELWLQNKGGSQQVLDLVLDAYIMPSIRDVVLSVNSITQAALFPCSASDTSFTLFNRGVCDTLTLNSADVVGSNWFHLQREPSFPLHIPPGDSVVISVHTQAAPSGSAAAGVQIIGTGVDTTINLAASVAPYTGPALAVISRDSLLVARICQVASGRIVFQNKTCGSVTVDSLSLISTGANGTKFYPGPHVLPDTVGTGDSISFSVLYDAGGSGNDSVLLKLHIAGGASADSVLVAGKVIGTPLTASLRLNWANGTASIKIPAGTSTDVILRMNDDVADTLNLTSVHAHLAFNDNILTPLPNGAQATNGWQVQKETDGVGFVDLDLSRQTTATIKAGDELARLHCFVTIADTLATSVVASQVDFNGGDSTYRRCTLAALPTVDTLSLTVDPVCGDSILSSKLRGVPLVTIMEIEPDPTTVGVAPHAIFQLSSDADVRVEILDLSGKSIARLAPFLLKSGKHDLTISEVALQSGIYFVRIEANGEDYIRKFVVK